MLISGWKSWLFYRRIRWLRHSFQFLWSVWQTSRGNATWRLWSFNFPYLIILSWSTKNWAWLPLNSSSLGYLNIIFVKSIYINFLDGVWMLGNSFPTFRCCSLWPLLLGNFDADAWNFVLWWIMINDCWDSFFFQIFLMLCKAYWELMSNLNFTDSFFLETNQRKGCCPCCVVT